LIALIIDAHPDVGILLHPIGTILKDQLAS
jgi:hypothetical protein